MEKYEISTIGEFHTNHNEDSTLITEISEEKILIAIMDGCSMGTESHFASTLIKKILRKIGKELGYQEFLMKDVKNNNDTLKEILKRLFKELKQIKNLLQLEREEVLSTLILGVLNSEYREADLITIGDGLISCNNELIEYEQDDKPDYLGYHLEENFESWLQVQTQILSLKNIRDLSICSDGIFTFKKFDNNKYKKIIDKEIVEFLLFDNKWTNQSNMLKKKTIELEKAFGLKPSDDLSIIRIKF